MSTAADALERRDPAEREAALMAALPGLVAAAQATPAGVARLRDVDPRGVRSRAALARLPLLRKSELLAAQRDAAAPDALGGFSAIGWAALARSRAGSGAVSPAGAVRPARRVYQSPGPIYEAEGHRPDPWRIGRAMRAAGFQAGDLVHVGFSYHLTPGAWMMESGAAALGCTTFPGGVGQTEMQLQAMAQLGADAYAGTPSLLRILLEKAAETGTALPSLRRALVSGEAFPGALRDWLAERGVTAMQAYATADVGLVAYETEAREGLVLDEEVIVEIVRPGTGDPVPEPAPGQPPEVGEVVVTALDPDYPLLRLATGDLSAVLPGPCPTGRTNTRIRGWLGRADQTAKVRGMFVHPSQVAALLARHPQLLRARLVVSGEMADDRLHLRAETAEPGDAALASALAASVRELTKLRSEVELLAPGALPNDGRLIEDCRKVG